jgi:hypothetical protein
MLIKSYGNNGIYGIIDFRDHEIICDECNKNHGHFTPPTVSEKLQEITDYFKENKTEVNGIDFSMNSISKKSIVQIINYCLNNENDIFSTTHINPFVILDFSHADIWNDDRERKYSNFISSSEFMDIISKIMYKYPYLCINLSDTIYDNCEKLDEFNNRYPLLKNRLILNNARKYKDNEKYENIHNTVEIIKDSLSLNNDRKNKEIEKYKNINNTLEIIKDKLINSMNDDNKHDYDY